MDKEQWSGILVWLEYCGQGWTELSLELLSKAKQLAEQTGEKIYGAAVVNKAAEEDLMLPVETLFLYEIPGPFHACAYEKALLDCIRKIHPSIVLAGGTLESRALISRVAIACRSGVTADCTELQINEDGLLLQTRPAFGGDIMANILTPEKRPQFATVRKGIFPEFSWKNSGRPLCIIQKMKAPDDCLLSSEPAIQQVGIEKARILVAAGRGVRQKEDLHMLEQLAQRLGGSLASSRALVEKGWISPDRQIGLSGKTVAPELLITCGVSGSVQFMTGIRRASCVIAINSDPEAPIFDVADYSLCGDIYEVIPQLLEKLEGLYAS